MLLVAGIYLLLNSSASGVPSMMGTVPTNNNGVIALVLIATAIIASMAVVLYFVYSKNEKKQRPRIETPSNIKSAETKENVPTGQEKLGSTGGRSKPFDVFLCYKKSSGKDYADHLKAGLEELGLHAFEDCRDIPQTVDTEEGWAWSRDKALEESKYFVLIMTPGFNLSREVVKEIGMARKQGNKTFVYFRHRSMGRNIVVNLGDETLDIGKLEQVSFETKEELLRLAHSILLNAKTP
ncbi:MAG: toll/interleukin-1 receptor domain-containing protein [Chloroflexi bacterium]|nr:toll/interleukin-1 receptor domain-containing protein [Chloroflexota bacterium]